jgi:hypothetical protein
MSKKIFLFFTISLSLMRVVGSNSQQSQTEKDMVKYLPVGQIHEVEGINYHILQLIAHENDHYIMYSESALIVEAIMSMISRS